MMTTVTVGHRGSAPCSSGPGMIGIVAAIHLTEYNLLKKLFPVGIKKDPQNSAESVNRTRFLAVAALKEFSL
jgi:hypothetical protein